MSRSSDLSQFILAVAVHFLCKLLDPISSIIRTTVLDSKFLSELAVDLLAYEVIIIILILVINQFAKVKPPHR